MWAKESSYGAIAIGLLVCLCVLSGCGSGEHRDTSAVSLGDFKSVWPKDSERVWVGPEYWANRLQDWQISGGQLECVEGRGQEPMRTVHLLTRQLAARDGGFVMSARTGAIGPAPSEGAAAGFLVGAGKNLDYRAASLIHHSPGQNGGLFAGIDGAGYLFFRDFGDPEFTLLAKSMQSIGEPRDVELRLMVKWTGPSYSATLVGGSRKTGQNLSSVKLHDIAAERLVGNVALVSHPGFGRSSGRFWFRDWKLSGSKVDAYPRRAVGPILSTQHTLSGNVLKMTAQMVPIGQQDTQSVQLQIRRNDKWRSITTAEVVTPGWTATFRVPQWNSRKNIRYRVVYELKLADGQTKPCRWSGMVRQDPAAKAVITVAAFTGNHNVRHPGLDSGKYTWTNDWLWFPHADLVGHVFEHKPDLLFFSGDQVYEGDSPTGADRTGESSSYLDYMYKWYLWCWAYRDLTRDIPCVCIPDDHDVYQGNLWGAGGHKTDKDDKGGYVMPADFVKMVERTQTSNLPDPFDPAPVEQGIGVYYTNMTYGRISFAVLEDRKFKSGCNGLVPTTTSGRADHVIDPNFDPKTADVAGAELLGERQLRFLGEWATDWQGADMKVALSQTMFGGLATHHGPGLNHLVVDYDTNGWPQTGRNKALDALRRCFAFHLAGDQHLATVVHHGIEAWNDACWAFAVPSIANFYPRAWLPAAPGANRKDGMPDYTGEFLDGLGNRVTVYAATNPGKSMGREPAELHDKMPGYGIVKFNKVDRTITMECWPRYADPTRAVDKQYEGWPITINQTDNFGQQAEAYLPRIDVSGMNDPVLQVIDEATGQTVYTIRMKGRTWRPKVFKQGTYTVKIGEPGTDDMKVLEHIESINEQDDDVLTVKF